MKRFLNIALCLLFLSACTPNEAVRGNFLFADDVQSLQPQTTTAFEVLNLLGSPTSKAVFDDKTWYYVGLKTEKESFFDEKVINRQVYKLTFNDENILETIAQIEGEAVDVPLATRVTPTSGNEITFVQQVLGNIGKFNPPAE